MLRVFYYLLFFLIPPLAVCSVIIYKSISEISFNDPQQIEVPEIQLPKPDKNKLDAVILVGNKGTEITDFLVPYQLLSETKSFNVFVVANHKTISPLNGGIDILPQYTLEEIDKLLSVPPDLIVVPSIPNVEAPDDKPLINWLRSKNNKNTKFLTISEGARVLAETGMIDFKKATTHWSAIGQLKRFYPNTDWISGVKYVEDGNVITTPGVVTGSMEGTLRVISEMIGKNEALKMSRKFGYRYEDSLNTKSFKLNVSDSIWLFTALYPWNKKRIGLYISPGVSEIQLSAFLDVYPRSFTADVMTYSDKRELIRTKNNLYLVPRFGESEIGTTDETISPEKYFDSSFPYDKALSDLSENNNKAIATTIAKTLGYDSDHLGLQGKTWPYILLLGPLFLGFLGILSAYYFDKRYLGG